LSDRPQILHFLQKLLFFFLYWAAVFVFRPIKAMTCCCCAFSNDGYKSYKSLKKN
jgi:hypothetical protein